MVSVPTLIVAGLTGVETYMLMPLILPMPAKMRKAVLRLVLESHMFAKLLYALKISLIFVTIIFVDAANQAFKLTFAGRSNQPDMDAPVDSSLGGSSNSSARKLLAERNLAVSGACLFVGMVLWRVFELNIQLVAAQDKLRKAEGQPDDGHSIEDSVAKGAAIKAEEKEKRRPQPRTRDFEGDEGATRSF